MRFLALFSLLLISAGAYAANGDPGLAQFFTLAPDDQSYVFLQNIFGQVGGVLQGQYGLLGHMFEKFNEVMLVLNTVVVGYATVLGAINTAKEGQFLGKNMDSLWVPLRSVAGIGLLIPTATGYCMLQIIMMWIVLQGAGAADTVWDEVINYVTTQSVAPPPGSGITNQLEIQMGTKLEDVFVGLSCMHLYYQANNSNASMGNDTSQPLRTYSSDNSMVVYYFPFTLSGAGNSQANQSDQGTCGSFSYPNPAYYNSTATPGSDYSNYLQAQAIDSSVQTILPLLNTAAMEFVYTCGTPPGTPPTNANNIDPATGSSCIAGTPIVTTATTVADNINQALTTYQQLIEQQSVKGILTNLAENYGWAFAGSFYHQLSQAYQGTTDISSIASKVSTQLPGNSDPIDSTLQTSIKLALANSEANALPWAPQLAQLTTANAAWQFGSAGANGLGGPMKVLANWIVEAFVGMITGGTNPFSGSIVQSGQDPIFGLQQLGENIINITDFFWFITMLALVIAISLTAACTGFNPFAGIAMILAKVMTVLFAFMSIFYVAGLTLSVYVPLVPYIIFLFGVLGWLIAVIETMLAAPMVAMGLTHPSGEGMLGRADPAVMLITNVFTRPTLMIFGLICGMLLARVAVDFVNATFDFVLLSNAGTAMDDSGNPVSKTSGYGVGPLQLVLYIVIYVSLIVVLINRCFALIHIVPDAVLRWIGGQHQFGEYAKGEEEVSGMAKSGAGQTAGSGMPDFGKKSAAGGMAHKGAGTAMGQTKLGANLQKNIKGGGEGLQSGTSSTSGGSDTSSGGGGAGGGSSGGGSSGGGAGGGSSGGGAGGSST